MRMNTKLFPVKILLVLCLMCPAKSFGFDQAVRVSDGKAVDFNQMIEDIKGVDLIFVGEVHSSMKHHKAQLDIIKALNMSKVPVAIGLEMFRADSQKELDKWVEGKMPLGVFVEAYNSNWGMPWPWYMNIFKYARQYDLPLIGLNLSGEITGKVSRRGFESLTRDELKQLPPDLRLDIDDRYKAHVRKIFDAHRENEGTFDNFCKAQMIWDTAMAYHVLNFLKKNQGKTVVVLAGADHAGGRGIPDQIKKRSEYHYKILLPEIAGHIERNTTTAEDADYLIPE
jgi:uncharacterized iron-regulated protein